MAHRRPIITIHFNSRSCEGATRDDHRGLPVEGISTHAPVKERLAAFGRFDLFDPFQLTLL